MGTNFATEIIFYVFKVQKNNKKSNSIAVEGVPCLVTRLKGALYSL